MTGRVPSGSVAWHYRVWPTSTAMPISAIAGLTSARAPTMTFLDLARRLAPLCAEDESR